MYSEGFSNVICVGFGGLVVFRYVWDNKGFREGWMKIGDVIVMLGWLREKWYRERSVFNVKFYRYLEVIGI